MSGDCNGPAEPAVVPEEILRDIAQRFRGFPVPEGSFNPSTASPELLRRFGLPPRPDAGTHPVLRRAWDRGFGRPMRLQAFELDLGRVEQTRYRLFSTQLREMSAAATRFETSSNWSGAYITANRDRRFLQVWGTWTIPDNLRLPPAPLLGTPGVLYVCSNWIGLDGQRLYLDSTLPQMGTVSKLEADGTITAEAWTQWWARGGMSFPPMPIGLAVAPGDDVLCVITAWDSKSVICVMVNLSAGPPRGMAVWMDSPPVELPDGSTVHPDIAGATAEWIVERPQVLNSTEHYNFPDYGETGFELCVAVEGDEVDIFSWFDGTPQQLQGTRRIRMFEVLQNPARTVFISMPRELEIDSFRVRYGGF